MNNVIPVIFIFYEQSTYRNQPSTALPLQDETIPSSSRSSRPRLNHLSDGRFPKNLVTIKFSDDQ